MNNISENSTLENSLEELIVSVTLFAFNLILFTLYVYVFKTNRERDKEIAIFPFMNHFFNVMKIYQVLIFYILAGYVFINIYREAIRSEIFGFLHVIWYFSLIVLIGMTEAFNVLLFLLAISRFSIYFWPSTEKLVKIIQTNSHKRVHYLYIAFIIKMLFFSIAFIYWVFSGKEKWYMGPAYIINQIFLHILIFVSGFLYIPIMISVRKLAHLASAQQNNPQRYILWQLISVLIIKLITFPFVLIGLVKIESFMVTVPLDCFLLPVLVQISYLGCNKRNVTTLLTSFRLKKFLQVLLDLKVTVNPSSTTDASTRF